MTIGTQRSARQLAATSIAVLLAVGYKGGLGGLNGLNILGVSIDPQVVWGAALWVISFQMATFLAHWVGDFLGAIPVNSGARISNRAHYAPGAPLLNSLQEVRETLLVYQSDQNEKLLMTGLTEGEVRQLLTDVGSKLELLKPSIKRLNAYALLYLFGLYLALPIVLALSALVASWSTM